MTLTSVIPRRIYDCRAMHCGKVDLSAVMYTYDNWFVIIKPVLSRWAYRMHTYHHYPNPQARFVLLKVLPLWQSKLMNTKQRRPLKQIFCPFERCQKCYIHDMNTHRCHSGTKYRVSMANIVQYSDPLVAHGILYNRS